VQKPCGGVSRGRGIGFGNAEAADRAIGGELLDALARTQPEVQAALLQQLAGQGGSDLFGLAPGVTALILAALAAGAAQLQSGCYHAAPYEPTKETPYCPFTSFRTRLSESVNPSFAPLRTASRLKSTASFCLPHMGWRCLKRSTLKASSAGQQV